MSRMRSIEGERETLIEKLIMSKETKIELVEGS